MTKLIDLTGLRIGKWIVLERAPNGKCGKPMWLCRCRCGREKVVWGINLRNGQSRGCQSCSATKHGQHGTRLYHIWRGMIDRCGNPKSMNYKYYGGRGIGICSDWHDLGVFIKWALSHGYKKELQIDRINNNGDYMPKNCRFVTAMEQSRNHRNNRYIKVGGKTKLLIEWAEQLKINSNTLRARFRRNWPEHRLLEQARSCMKGLT